MHSVEEKSYQGTTQRDTVKGLLSRIYISVWQKTYTQEPHKETHEESC